MILNYIQVNPSKQIHLIACSNGCRIASWIEYNLHNFKVLYHDLKYGYDPVSLGWYLSNEIVKNSINWFNNTDKSF